MWDTVTQCQPTPQIYLILHFLMIKFVCSDYGYECDFEIEDEDISTIINGFSKHMAEVHGIEYAKEALMQFILRKHG